MLRFLRNYLQICQALHIQIYLICLNYIFENKLKHFNLNMDQRFGKMQPQIAAGNLDGGAGRSKQASQGTDPANLISSARGPQPQLERNQLGGYSLSFKNSQNQAQDGRTCAQKYSHLTYQQQLATGNYIQQLEPLGQQSTMAQLPNVPPLASSNINRMRQPNIMASNLNQKQQPQFRSRVEPFFGNQRIPKLDQSNLRLAASRRVEAPSGLNKRPLQEIEPMGAGRDVLDAIDEMPPVTKPDFGKLACNREDRHELFEGIEQDLRASRRYNVSNTMQKQFQKMRSHHAPVQPGQPTQNRYSKFHQMEEMDDIQLMSINQNELSKISRTPTAGRNAQPDFDLTLPDHSNSQQSHHHHGALQNDFLTTNAEERANEVAQFLDQHQERQIAMKKVNHIWRSCSELHSNMHSDKLHEEGTPDQVHDQTYVCQIGQIMKGKVITVANEPIRLGGFLDHLGCIWKVDEDSKTRLSIITVSLNAQIHNLHDDHLMQGQGGAEEELEFGSTITHVQCFELPPLAFRSVAIDDGRMKSEYRILIFTTDRIFQVKAEIKTRQNNQPKKIVFERDDNIYKPILTNQIEYTFAKQHPNGLVVAGGSRGQAISVWIDGPNKDGQSIISQALSFINEHKKGKLNDRRVGVSFKDRLKNIMGFLNLKFGEDQFACIDFQPYHHFRESSSLLAATLVLNDSYPTTLSKINIYTIQSPQRSLALSDYPSLSFTTSVTLKQILYQAQKIARSTLAIRAVKIAAQIDPCLAPVHIQFGGIEGNLLDVYLKNGIVISLNIRNLEDLKVCKIDCSPLSRAVKETQSIIGQIQSANQEASDGENEGDANTDGVNPLFPQIHDESKLRFGADRGGLDSLAKADEAPRSEFRLDLVRQMVEGSLKIQVYLVSQWPSEMGSTAHYLMLQQRDIFRDSIVIASVLRLQGGKVLDVLFTKHSLQVLYANGQIQNLDVYSSKDSLCQYLSMSWHFQSQNEQRGNNLQRSDNLLHRDFDQSSAAASIKQLQQHLGEYVESLYQDLLTQLDQPPDSIQEDSVIINRSHLFQFLANLLQIALEDNQYQNSSIIQSYYAQANNPNASALLDFESQENRAECLQPSDQVRAEACKLLSEVLDKYFGKRFQKDASGIAPSKQFDEVMIDEGPQQFQKVDLRDDYLTCLDLSRYSPMGQVRAMLVMDAVRYITDETRGWLKQKVFYFDSCKKEILVNQVVVQKLQRNRQLSAMEKLVKEARDTLLVSNNNPLHQSIYFNNLNNWRIEGNQMSRSFKPPLFESLLHLVKYVHESLDFFNLALVKNSQTYEIAKKSVLSNQNAVPGRVNSEQINQETWFKQFEQLITQRPDSGDQVKAEALQAATIENFIIDGPAKSPIVQQIIETFLKYDQGVTRWQCTQHSNPASQKGYNHKDVVGLNIDQDYAYLPILLRERDDYYVEHFKHYIEPALMQALLSRKYFHISKKILKDSDNPSALDRLKGAAGAQEPGQPQATPHLQLQQRIQRNRYIQRAMGYQLKNALTSSLTKASRMLIENELYDHCVVYCLKKIADCTQALKHLAGISKAQHEGGAANANRQKVPTQHIKPLSYGVSAASRHTLNCYENIDKMKEHIEHDAELCQHMILDMLQAIFDSIEHQRQKNEPKAKFVGKAIDWGLVPAQRDEAQPNSLIQNQPVRTDIGQQERARSMAPFATLTGVFDAVSRILPWTKDTRARTGEVDIDLQTHDGQAAFFGMFRSALRGQTSQQPTGQGAGEASPIDQLKFQLKDMGLRDLLDCKKRLLGLLERPESFQGMADQDYMSGLHFEIFRLLMENNLVDDLFGFQSPWLAEFIQSDMWRERISATKDGCQGDAEGPAENKEGQENQRFARILDQSCKHFAALHQPVNLFNYVYDVLIENVEDPAYVVDVEDRIKALQRGLEGLDEAQGCTNQMSSDFNQQVEQAKFILKILGLQKILRGKMRKQRKQINERREDRENKSLQADIETIDDKLSNSITSNPDQLLQVAQDYLLFSSQLRIIGLMLEETSIRADKRKTIQEAIQSAWHGLIYKSYSQKLSRPGRNIEEYKDFVICEALDKFKQKLRTFKRLVGNNHGQDIIAFDEYQISQGIIQQTQLLLNEGQAPLEFYFENRQIYWCSDFLTEPGDLSSSARAFRTFYKIYEAARGPFGNDAEQLFNMLYAKPLELLYPAFHLMDNTVAMLQSGQPYCRPTQDQKLELVAIADLADHLLQNFFRICFDNPDKDPKINQFQLRFSTQMLATQRGFADRFRDAITTVRSFAKHC